jgi:hypothetical protein
MTVTVRYLGEARKGIGKKLPDPPLELGFADLVAQELVPQNPSAANLPERMKGVLTEGLGEGIDKSP